MIPALAVTLAIFAAGVTDPNRATPLNVAVYATALCGQARVGEVLPIVNPVTAFYPDPADPSRDCRVDVQAQFAALPVGSGYRAALRTEGVYGPLGTVFEVRVAAPPPPVIVSSLCVTDPLRLTNVKWPLKATGAGTSLTFTARNRTSLQPWVSFAFVWPGRLTVTDTRGCVTTELK